MPANPSLIDTMARAMFDADTAPDTSRAWAETAEYVRSPYITRARAALRSLIDAGPTEAMIDAGLKVTCGGLDDEANRYWQAEEYKAMLRAALEEAGNHG